MEDKLLREFVDRVRAFYGDREEVSLHEPSLGKLEIEYVTECIKGGWISSAGSWGSRFENDLCAYTGSAHAIVTVNGTAALHCILQLLGVESNDEVLVPAISFVATANAVSYTGASAHFVDVEASTLCVDPIILERYLATTTELRDGSCVNRQTGRKIKGLVVVHVFGCPANMAALCEIAKRYKLFLVEDAAESLGSWFEGRHTGCFGTFGALSFNGNKIITTGGGGAILTQDKSLAYKARHLTTTAKLAHKWEYIHDQVGYNYRLPGINAALGSAQLAQLPEFLKRKNNLAVRMKQLIQGFPDISLIEAPANCRSNNWLLTAKLPLSTLADRDRVIHEFHRRKIYVRPLWKLLPTLAMYRDHPSMSYPVARALEAQIICLPSSAFLSD